MRFSLVRVQYDEELEASSITPLLLSLWWLLWNLQPTSQPQVATGFLVRGK
jgi:hypothetical protein